MLQVHGDHFKKVDFQLYDLFISYELYNLRKIDLP